jgi:hypothetical protein
MNREQSTSISGKHEPENLRRGIKENPPAFGKAMSPDALDIANALEDLAAGLRLDPSGGYDHTGSLGTPIERCNFSE